MNIRRRNAGEILMAVGIGCGIAYVLINLYILPPAWMRFAIALLYASIAALLSGLIFYLLSRTGNVS